jgi:DNA-binding CsgD family transcriptional regulator
MKKTPTPNASGTALQEFIQSALKELQHYRQSTKKPSSETKKMRYRRNCHHIVPGAYLTYQEERCIIELVKGKKYREIGLALQLSTRTVEFYMKNIQKKFNCANKKALCQRLKPHF